MARTDIGRAVPLLKGEYSPTTTYELNDIVSLNGSFYWHYSHEQTTNVAPQATSTWKVVINLADAEAYIARAEFAAESAEDAAEIATAAKTAAESASTTATGASATATAAKNDALTAKTAAETAQAGAVTAKTAAETARDAAQASATAAGTSATNAGNSAGTAEYYAGIATTAGETANEKATEATGAATTATSAAATATSAKDTAVSSASTASTAATTATSAATAAQAVKDSIPQDYTSLSEDVDDLKTQLTETSGNTFYKVTEGAYIDIAHPVGYTVDLEHPTTRANYGYAIIDCNEGESYTITGTVGSLNRLIALLDTDNKIIHTSNASGTSMNNFILVIPTNAKKIVINVLLASDYSIVKNSFVSYSIKNIQEKSASMFNDGRLPVGEIVQGVWNATYGSFGDSSTRCRIKDALYCPAGTVFEYIPNTQYCYIAVFSGVPNLSGNSALETSDWIGGANPGKYTLTHGGFVTINFANGSTPQSSTDITPSNVTFEIKYVFPNEKLLYSLNKDVNDLDERVAALENVVSDSDGYAINSAFLRQYLKMQNLGNLSSGQAFCVYNDKYYSTDGEHIYIQDSDFTLTDTISLSTGHGNSFQLGDSNIAYISGWNNNKLYAVDLDTVTISETIDLDTQYYTGAVYDEANDLLYIFQKQTAYGIDNWNFIVKKKTDGTVVTRRKTSNKFADIQGADFYKGRIIVAYGLGTDVSPCGICIYNTNGDVISEIVITKTLDHPEFEGVCFTRNSQTLLLSTHDKKLFSLT